MNVDDCEGAPCQNGGARVDGVASFSCECAAGLQGSGINIDDRVDEPCQNFSECVDGVNGNQCEPGLKVRTVRPILTSVRLSPALTGLSVRHPRRLPL